MDKRIEQQFLSEISQQCEFALTAKDDLDQAIASMTQNFSVNMLRAWYSINAFLQAVGVISKILWPPRNKYDARGEHLRQLLNMDTNSTLSDRSVRNRIEHIDEQLDEHFKKGQGLSLRNMGDPNTFAGNMSAADHFLFYDPSRKIIYFLGETIKLVEVCNELNSTRQVIRQLQQTQNTKQL